MRSGTLLARLASLETLELRRLLADVAVSGDASGFAQADTFVVDRSGTTGRVFLNGSATPAATWSTSSDTRLVINALSGNDLVQVSFAAGSPFGTGGMSFDGGVGTDQLTLDDSSGADLFELLTGLVRVNGAVSSYAGTELLQLEVGGGTDTLNAGGAASLTAGSAIVRVLNNGTLKPATGAVMPTVLDIDLASGASFDLAGVNTTIDALTGAGTVRNNGAAATLSVGSGNSSFAFGGTLANGTGTLAIAKRGTGRFDLSSANSYSGATTILDGALRILNSGALGSSASGTQIQAGRIELSGNLTIAEPIEILARAPDGQGLFTPAIQSLSGASFLTGGISLSFGGLGYLFQVDSGALRITGDITRTDSSTYHRPLMLGGAGVGSLEGMLKSNTTWGYDLRKRDAGTWTVSSQVIMRNVQVDAGVLDINRLGNGSVSVVTGTLRIKSQPQASDPDGTSSVSSIAVSTVAQVPSGNIDLGNNVLVVDYSASSPFDQILALVRSGYAGGSWQGNGILSSFAQANSSYSVGVALASEIFTSFPAALAGATIDSTAVVLRYTLAGDANLDGKVGFDDLLLLAQSYGQPENRWSHGDFNYDGTVGFDDLLILAQNYGKLLDVSQNWTTIPAVNFSNISPSAFTDDELRYVLPLYNFNRIANAVVQDGSSRGFIDLKVWRDPADNQPYNARVLENQVWFAFFYATNRPWNPYYQSNQVRYRLEAMLDFWAASQGPAGTWAEYGAGQYGLAPTSFGLRAAVNTLELLQGGPPIDAAVMQRTVNATLTGLRAMLSTATLLSQGNDYSNQYSAVYSTTLTFVRLYPQYRDELVGYLRQRLPQAAQLHQSPAGFMYEAGATDWAYTLGTHQTNLTNGWHELKGSEFEPIIVDEERKLYTFTGYNLIREPNGSGYFSNFGATSRTLGSFFSTGFNANPIAELAPEARFLARTAADESAALTSLRSSLTSQWNNWPALQVPSSNSYTPSGVIDRDRIGWRPTSTERSASISALPYMASTSFNHQAADDRRPIQFTYVRRPTYYSTLTTGRVVTSLQRYGLGVLWNPTMGSVMQSQANSNSLAWGTRIDGAAKVYEAATITTGFTLNGQTLNAAVGSTRLAGGNLSASYGLGTAAGTKAISYDDTGINVSVTHAASFTEELPLLRGAGESIVLSQGRATLTRNGVTLVIEYGSNIAATVTNTATSPGNSMTVSLLTLRCTTGQLNYRISFTSPAALQMAPTPPVKHRTGSFAASFFDAGGIE